MFHQNIRGLKVKHDELICSLISHKVAPHLICLSEHYLTEQNLITINPENYNLSSNFSHTNYNGTRFDLQHSLLDVSQFCIEKNFEICAVQIDLGNYYVIVVCIYRSQSGNFYNFLNQLDLTLKHLYKPRTEFIICDDLNVNFLIDTDFKLQLSLLFQTYNLFCIVEFPTRFNKNLRLSYR
jgi:exonuclease III